MFVMHGDHDEAMRTLEMDDEAPARVTADLAQDRSVLTALDDGSRRFVMFMTLPDVGDVKMMGDVHARAE